MTQTQQKKLGREARFLNALLRGRAITRKQAMREFKLANPSAAVLRFQERGYDLVRAYNRKSKKAPRTVKYTVA